MPSPALYRPVSSGPLTCTSTTSIGRRPLDTRPLISEILAGMTLSERPAKNRRPALAPPNAVTVTLGWLAAAIRGESFYPLARARHRAGFYTELAQQDTAHEAPGDPAGFSVVCTNRPLTRRAHRMPFPVSARGANADLHIRRWNQLAGISKAHPRQRETRFLQIGGAARPRPCAARRTHAGILDLKPPASHSDSTDLRH